MIDWAKWPEMAVAGMDILGAGVGAWYVASKYMDRVRRNADRALRSFEQPQDGHAERSQFGLNRETYNSTASFGKEADTQTGAEDLLVARMLRFGDPCLATFWEWGEKIAHKLRSLGWLRVPLLAPAGLVFLVLFGVSVILLLPIVVVGYFFDIDNDVRLRIIVLAFALGIILQIVGAVIA